MRAGLILYDLLAGRYNFARHRRLTREEALKLAPQLDPAGLKGAFLYYDARTNDARLVVEIIKAANERGAAIASYVSVTNFIRDDGGKIVGLDGVRDAYLTGRGSFRIRATARIEQVHARRKGIVVTELPYMVGPERIVSRIQELVNTGKLVGVSDVKNLQDRRTGMNITIECKPGVNAKAILTELYRLTPMEETFGVNNVVLVNGVPTTVGLWDLCNLYAEHRLDVVRRRTEYRLGKRRDRLHLVEGLLIAIVDIDEVIQLIRSSDDVATAKARLIEVFDLSDIQATYILDLQLRRLTKFSRIELEAERAVVALVVDAAEPAPGPATPLSLGGPAPPLPGDAPRPHGRTRHRRPIGPTGGGGLGPQTTSTPRGSTQPPQPSGLPTPPARPHSACGPDPASGPAPVAPDDRG